MAILALSDWDKADSWGIALGTTVQKRIKRGPDYPFGGL